MIYTEKLKSAPIFDSHTHAMSRQRGVSLQLSNCVFPRHWKKTQNAMVRTQSCHNIIIREEAAGFKQQVGLFSYRHIPFFFFTIEQWLGGGGTVAARWSFS